jgi:hypothetical protein
VTDSLVVRHDPVSCPPGWKRRRARVPLAPQRIVSREGGMDERARKWHQRLADSSRAATTAQSVPEKTREDNRFQMSATVDLYTHMLPLELRKPIEKMNKCSATALIHGRWCQNRQTEPMISTDHRL